MCCIHSGPNRVTDGDLGNLSYDERTNFEIWHLKIKLSCTQTNSQYFCPPIITDAAKTKSFKSCVFFSLEGLNTIYRKNSKTATNPDKNILKCRLTCINTFFCSQYARKYFMSTCCKFFATCNRLEGNILLNPDQAAFATETFFYAQYAKAAKSLVQLLVVLFCSWLEVGCHTQSACHPQPAFKTPKVIENHA